MTHAGLLSAARGSLLAARNQARDTDEKLTQLLCATDSELAASLDQLVSEFVEDYNDRVCRSEDLSTPFSVWLAEKQDGAS